MDKKKYNQMGFDFGDTDPAQETPAAGFRIKSIKPSSREEAGESEQDTDDQENFTSQSGVNGQYTAPGPVQNGSAPTVMVFEQDPEKQKSESNPNNDSEVITNTPVTTETEAHADNPEQAQTKHEAPQHDVPQEMTSEEKIDEAPEAEEEKAVEEMIKEEEEEKENVDKLETDVQQEQPQVVAQTVSTPNIPSRLTRPTQVYAVEENETPIEKKNTDIGFTPASQHSGKATTTNNKSENTTAEEKAANAEQLPVATNAATSEQPVAAEATVAETSSSSTMPVAENTEAAEQAVEQKQEQPVAQNSNTEKVEEPVTEQNTTAVKEEQPAEQLQEQPAKPVTDVQSDSEQNTKAASAAQPETGANTGVVATPKVTAQTSAVEEPEQAYPNNQTQDSNEEEEYHSDDTNAGINFNTPEPEPELPKKSTRGRKSLKTLDAEASAMNIPEDATLFKRQYYSIGEVAGMFGVNQSLLRFWENEFDIIQPRKNRKGDRHFRPLDIKNLELIYDLLRRRKLTIEGAKEFLKKNKQARERFEMIQSLQQIKGFLLEIKASL